MERIPVVRKKSSSAWLWAILLLALLALLYFLFFKDNNAGDGEMTDDTTVTTTTTDSTITAPPVNPNDASNSIGEVNDLKPVYTAVNKQEYIGRQLNLQNVQVQGVWSDTTFWIGDSKSERIFVIGYKSGSKAQQLKEGQRISIKGILEKMPDEATRKSGWGITDAQTVDFQGQELYLRAQEIM